MESISLSFKEWPFLSSSDIPKSDTFSGSASFSDTINLLKSTIRSNLILESESSSESSEVELNQPTENQANTNKKLNHLSAWSQCGLFACSFESGLSIFSEDDSGCLSPMFMFSPFEQFNVGQINKQNFRNTVITAIAWSDGYLQPSIAKPILAVASVRGHIAIYDFTTKKTIAHHLLNDLIVSISWSTFKINRFYVGSSKGKFYVCELKKNSIQILKTLDFYSFATNASDVTKPKSVDFIVQDGVDGQNIVIASKDGTIGFLTNMNEIKNAKLQVFQQLPFKIKFCEFFPNSQDFLMVSTSASTFLISISKGILIPFIQTHNCKFISVLEDSNDKVVVGSDNEIEIWRFADNQWIRSCHTKFGGKFGLAEILTYSKINGNKVLLTTSSNWLTEVEFRRNKVFVSKRIRLLNGTPNDYDFGNGLIAFLTKNSMISLTLTTPGSMRKPKFNEEQRRGSVDLASFHFVNNNNNNNEETNKHENTETPLSILCAIDTNELNLVRRHSMTTEPSFQIKPSSAEQNENESPAPAADQQQKMFINNINENDENESVLGHSNSIVMSFIIDTINEDEKIKNVQWISSSKIVAWSDISVYLIDLKNRTITEPLIKKYDKQCNIITQVFLSKNKKLMCVILNHRTAHILNTELNFDVINSIDFSKIIMKEYNILLGSFSPKEDQVVFATQNLLFFSKLKENEPLEMTQIITALEFDTTYITWRNRGVIIGTEKGSVFLIVSKKIDDIYNSTELRKRDIEIIYDPARQVKKKLGQIRLVSPCFSKLYIIIDTFDQGILVSGDALSTISDNIRCFKQCSKKSFLIRIHGFNKIIAMSLFGDFSPSSPPCFISAKKNNLYFNPTKVYTNMISKDKKSNDLVKPIIQQLFRSSEDDPSISLRNSVQLLIGVISLQAPFSTVSSKALLKLGNLKLARDLLLKTDPSDKDYFNNMMLVAAYDSNENYLESADLVVKNLVANNRIKDAVYLLLMTKNIHAAVELLYMSGKNKDAYRILMLNGYKADSESSKEMIQKIANSLITKRENPIFGLKLLASLGYTQEMINQLSLILE